MDLKTLLTLLDKQKASDLHLKVGTAPIVRNNQGLTLLDPGLEPLSHETMESLSSYLLNEKAHEKLNDQGSVDVGYGLPGLGRFRCNISYQRGSLRIVIRRIPYAVPSLKELNLPEKLKDIAETSRRGLILITGHTGSGKSTTMASLIDHINHNRSAHILTIEDPIEFLIKDHHSLITQRELDVDFYDPDLALKAALRQDPDIITLSEMRMKDTIKTALIAAETGHLVLSTLHTQDTAESISRILNIFSEDEQPTIRTVLSSVLTAVIGQRLVPKKDGTGLVPAVEIMINNAHLQKEIGKASSTQTFRSIIQQSTVDYGMQSFDQHLAELVKKDIVSEKSAMNQATSRNNLKMMISGISFKNTSKVQTG